MSNPQRNLLSNVETDIGLMSDLEIDQISDLNGSSLNNTPRSSSDNDQSSDNGQSSNDQHSNNQSSDEQPSDDQHSNNQPSDNKPSDNKQPDNQPSDNKQFDDQLLDNQSYDKQPSDNQSSDNKQFDEQPSDNKPPDDQPFNDTINTTEVLNMQYFMKKITKTVKFEEVRSMLYKMGIRTSYDKSRMIFSTLHSCKNRLNNVYLQECNGLILEMDTWRPLMVPPRSLRFNINTITSNEFLHKGYYHIYKSYDGTCVNFYYYHNQWYMSTARGYDMNNVMWNNLTYEQVFKECLEAISITWEDFLASLNPSCCYSFGFKHPVFHPFLGKNFNQKYNIWFIQSININPKHKNYLWASDRSPHHQILSQEFLTEHVRSLKDLYKQASSALTDFINDTSSEPCYGFILRSINFEVTKDHSDLFIESSLLRIIRKIWYENQITEICKKNNHVSRTDIIILNAYLDDNLHNVFLQLFPQYAPNFKQFSNKLQKIIDLMLQISNQGSEHAITMPINILDKQSDQASQANTANPANTANQVNPANPANQVNPTNQLEIVARQLLTQFYNLYKYSLTNINDQKRKIFSEFVIHPVHLELLIKYLII